MNRLILFCIALISCRASAAEPRVPVRVELHGQPGGWQLLRAGKPYFIQGGGGRGSQKALVAAGGNSIRTWAPDNIDAQLDEAQSLGLTVTIGIWLGHPRHGFNYGDAKQVGDQLDMAKAAILKYRDHPAVLMWGLGNEMESVGSEDNAALWSALNNLASMVHKLDPNHPTMTVVAGIGGKKVSHINKLCPDIDIIGINQYGGITSLPQHYKKAGGTKPYVVSEFGPPGVWETGKNSFGSAPELTSTQKAGHYANAWKTAVASQKGSCLGGYAFVWGHKQEATATWFGTFLPDGARLGAVDALTEVWTGKPPLNCSPVIERLTVDGEVDVNAESTVRAVLEASDPEGDPLTVKWVLQAETSKLNFVGDVEMAPKVFPEAIVRFDGKGAEVKMPRSGGSYRLFAYVYDDHGGAAVANIPIHVKGAGTSRK